MKALILVFSLIGGWTQVTAQLALPDGNGGWVVQVVTSGGFSGTGGGDFTISSQGKILCSAQMSCPKNFVIADFQPLVEIIRPDVLPVLPPAVVSLCRDCITRTITIRRRDSIGVVHTYTASWDDTTKSKLPQEVIRIYDAILTLPRN